MLQELNVFSENTAIYIEQINKGYIWSLCNLLSGLSLIRKLGESPPAGFLAKLYHAVKLNRNNSGAI